MDTTSVIRAGLRELNVELILAHSPQAKGRVERKFGTSQEANQYLEEVYIPFWNQRFAVEPAEPHDVHRRLPKQFDLESLFAETLTRTIGHDFTLTHKSRKLKILKSQARGLRPGQKLTIEVRLDGSTCYRWKNRYLDLEVIAKAAPARRKPKKPAVARPASPPPKPGPDHPWRQTDRLIANPRAVARYRRMSAAAQPTLPTPSEEGVLVKPCLDP